MAPNQAPETGHASAVEEPPRPKGILERMHKYLLLLAILAATVTYNAGLSPPGGVWADDADGHLAGDPVLQVLYPLHCLHY
jgi:sister-chromatid-cohesion protein PDS5